MELLKDLYYSKEHTWVRIENKIATVGITAFAQKELGEIVYVDLPNLIITSNKTKYLVL